VNTYERISSEYQQIQSTDFWKMFVKMIQERRSAVSRICETNEVVTKFQGELEGLDFVIGRGKEKHPLAERLLDDLRDNKR